MGLKQIQTYECTFFLHNNVTYSFPKIFPTFFKTIHSLGGVFNGEKESARECSPKFPILMQHKFWQALASAVFVEHTFGDLLQLVVRRRASSILRRQLTILHLFK